MQNIKPSKINKQCIEDTAPTIELQEAELAKIILHVSNVINKRKYFG